MSRELRHMLTSFVLMIAIWAATLFLRGPYQNAIGIVLIIGSLLATIDFLRAFWRYVQSRLAPEESEDADGF